MGVELRRAGAADAEVCRGILYEAFKGIADRHGFPPPSRRSKWLSGSRISSLASRPCVRPRGRERQPRGRRGLPR